MPSDEYMPQRWIAHARSAPDSLGEISYHESPQMLRRHFEHRPHMHVEVYYAQRMAGLDFNKPRGRRKASS